jgi:hypothetical protein
MYSIYFLEGLYCRISLGVILFEKMDVKTWGLGKGLHRTLGGVVIFLKSVEKL